MKFIRTLFVILIAFSALKINAQAPTVVLQPFASGFVRPVDIAHCNDSRLFVVEQDGYINVVNPSGSVLPIPFLNIDTRVGSSGNEQGLLGLAFHPNYKQNGYFYVDYTNNAGNTVISRFNVSLVDSNLADATSELILMTIYQPFSNHNGGCIKFGPDGYLYIGMGDGGSGGDPGNRSQNKDSLLGKMLRIDVDNGTPYAIPADNPFVNVPNARDEIWATGLRNPWRWSFDRLTGDMWIADVGQNNWEEIDFQKGGIAGGQNYGWRCYEGNHAYNTAGCLPQSSYIAAVFELSHTSYCSISGGYIYRGGKYSDLFGFYFFADYCNDMIQVLKRLPTGVFQHYNTINYTNASIVAFGEDYLGELYVVDLSGGAVRKIVSSICTPTAFIAESDTMIVCADSVELSTPYGDSLFYSWQTPSGVSSSNSIWVNQSGWASVNVLNLAACQNTDSVYVLINGFPPAASFTGLDTTYCYFDGVIDSLVGTPTGGAFSGTGITGNLFYADSAYGVNSITYVFTDAGGCISSASQTTSVSLCGGINQKDKPVFAITGSNPAFGFLKFQVESTYSGLVQSTITDISGRNISKSSFMLMNGPQTISLPMENAENGIYFWNISNGESAITYRFIWTR